MKDRYRDRIYDRYGFVAAFNPNGGWIEPDCIGIDVGIRNAAVSEACVSAGSTRRLRDMLGR